MIAPVTCRDLHALAARLCLENIGTVEDRGEGFVVVFADSEGANITAAFGVRPWALTYLHEADDGTLGIGGDLPSDGAACEVVCRVVTEPPRMGAGLGVIDDGLAYLEIVWLDGVPAMEVHR